MLVTTHSRIDADLLIPGQGRPIENGTLVFSPTTSDIQFVGSSTDLPPDYSSLKPIAKVPTLMPGLWDCHVHLMGGSSTGLEETVLQAPALAGARCARDAAATLNAGYTSIREVAGHGAHLRKAIEEGWLPGPNIYTSVSILSQTAGHGDAHSMPLELVRDRMKNPGLPLHLCDGVDECIKAVRMKVREGADLIKVAATGGVLSIIDSPQAQQFSDEELEAIVKEAARTDKIVAAHCHGKKGIMAALKAGCMTIEHGSFLDQEAIDLMLEKDATLVATRSIIEFGIQHPDLYPREVYDKMQEVNQSHKKSYAKAVRAGVRIALGTDLGISSNKVMFNHGMNGKELRYAVNAGMTPLEAIEAATARGPATLGPQAPKSGQLKAGYDADFIALSRDPLRDIDAVGDVSAVTHVWKGGKLYKAPGHPITFTGWRWNSNFAGIVTIREATPRCLLIVMVVLSQRMILRFGPMRASTSSSHMTLGHMLILLPSLSYLGCSSCLNPRQSFEYLT